MRFGMLTLTLSILLIAFLSNANQDKGEEIIRSAVKAHGGAEKLARATTGRLRGTAATFGQPLGDSACKWEEYFDFPQRLRKTVTVDDMGKELTMVHVSTQSGKGWSQSFDGVVADREGDKLNPSGCWYNIIPTLASASKAEVAVAVLDRQAEGERHFVGVRLSGGQFGNGTVLYFDEKTHLLAKAKKELPIPGTNDTQLGDIMFSDYESVAEIKFPHRLTTFVDGKKVAELVVNRAEFGIKVDDSVFKKPASR